MATIITKECINCGACEPECPNTAIYAGGVEWELNGVKHPPIATDIFYIVRDKCTECVGFFDHEACAEACPVDCCIPDANDPEGEDVLIGRAKRLHPDRTFAGDLPSRFRKAGAAPAPAPPKEAAPPAAAAPTSAPSEAPAPAAAPTRAATPTAAAGAAPVTAAAAEPPPAAPPAAAPMAAAKPAPAAAPAVKPAAAKPTVEPKAAAPKAAPAATPQPEPAAAPPPAVPAVPVEVCPGVPDIEQWEIPIECFRCRRPSAVPFKHFRTGVVLYCPVCQGSYVVNTSMHKTVDRALRDFHKRLREQLDRFQAQHKKELEDFEQEVRAQIQAFNESLNQVSREFRPPGAPRQRARFFGQHRS